MSKYFFILFILSVLSNTGAGQLLFDPEVVIRNVADNIVNETTYNFYDRQTGEKFDEADDRLIDTHFRVKSPFNEWRYENGVLAIGMVALSKALDDTVYEEYATKNYEFAFNNIKLFEPYYGELPWVEYQRFFRTRELDDCGAMGAGLLDVNQLKPRADYEDYFSRVSNHILNVQHRLADGTLCRKSPREDCIWADDLYMSVPFLARMGKKTGDSKYFDDAVLQVEKFHEYLWNDSKKLYHHGYWSDEDDVSIAHWGRCNGWIIMAKVELLKHLPENHPKRDRIASLLLEQIKGTAGYQSESGLWHQVLDRPDSYLETSVTAMFVFAIAHAVNQGWINKGYMKIAQQGWDGLTGWITPDGQLKGTCMGTGLHEDIIYYFKRRTPLNDIHGLGALLLAGAEMVETQKKGNVFPIEKRY